MNFLGPCICITVEITSFLSVTLKGLKSMLETILTLSCLNSFETTLTNVERLVEF